MNRAARDHLESRPEFAAEAALAALYWIANGYGYEITGVDVVQAHGLAQEAAVRCGRIDQVRARVEEILDGNAPAATWMRTMLGPPR